MAGKGHHLPFVTCFYVNRTHTQANDMWPKVQQAFSWFTRELSIDIDTIDTIDSYLKKISSFIRRVLNQTQPSVQNKIRHRSSSSSILSGLKSVAKKVEDSCVSTVSQRISLYWLYGTLKIKNIIFNLLYVMFSLTCWFFLITS